MKKHNRSLSSSLKEECSVCNTDDSVIYRPQSGQYLCRGCFNKSIEKIIYKTISKYNMLKPSDKIIVGVSGGKDSITLLYNLIKIQQKTHGANPPIALSIDEGIANYRKKSIYEAQKFCKKFGIEHHIILFKERVGKSLEDIIDIEKVKENNRYACNYCAIIRRRLLNDCSLELGGTILALGHNLTDFCETFLMNILFKRLHLIARRNPSKKTSSDIKRYYIRKINPLMKIPETEIEKYVNLKNLPFYSSHCPYRTQDPILRKRVLDFILECKKFSPEIEYNLFNGFLELSEILNKEFKSKKLNFCSICGYPTSNESLCNYCNLKQKITI
ncbi:MAG: hypothetical protein GF317_17740 [Candidatus Lokiarchaeota archaeon]|nr:hypothetical protein [Candidatus Lokiarchaeota archaeon]MBD3201356.1 hypothetical protein [Candidatus Lokiarchaeota archaeon]